MGIRAELKKHLKRKSKGQQIIEVTLIFLPLVLLVGAAVDWGMGLFVSHLAQNAAREGARAAAVLVTPGSGSCTYPCASEPSGSVLKVAANSIPNANLFSGFTITNGGLTGTCPDRTVSVTISGIYNFRFLRLIGFIDPMTISRTARINYERELCSS